MLTTMTLVAALSLAPAQAGALELTNIRPTYGLMGPARPDSKLLPGDIFFVSYDIENVQANADGEVLYSVGMEVVDSRQKTQFKQDAQDQKKINHLGGNRLPGFANAIVGQDMPAGEYTLRVTVTDRTSKQSSGFERKFEVLDRAFGIVRLNLTSDPQGQTPMPPLGVPGQTAWIHFTVVGFERGSDNNQPNIGLEMQIVDENDKPTLSKPVSGDVTALPKNEKVVAMDFPLALNRAGKFSVKLKATDRSGNKTAELAFPIRIVDVDAK